jgi:hypothetical protein
MPPLDVSPTGRPSIATVALSLAPWAILLFWFLTGGWTLAGQEARAWLQFAGLIALALLVPLPTRDPSTVSTLGRAKVCGWTMLVGVLVTV